MKKELETSTLKKIVRDVRCDISNKISKGNLLTPAELEIMFESIIKEIENIDDVRKEARKQLFDLANNI